jgi:iron complex outermembrane recepter protein
MRSKICVGHAVAVLLAGAAHPAFSQSVGSAAAASQTVQTSPSADDGEETALEEIVVTALRRDQKLSETPASVTAIGGVELERRGARDVTQLLGLVPGLSNETAQNGYNKFTIRGVNAGGQYGNRVSAATAIYLDEVPVSSRVNFWAGPPDLSLYDIERVEVLRGPQGTLYGASAIGGAIRIIPQAPDASTFSARVAGEVGFTEGAGDLNFALRGTMNVPLVQDRVGLLLTAERDERAGFLDALLVDEQEVIAEADDPSTPRIKDFNDRTLTNLRAALVFAPDPTLRITPSLFHQRQEAGGLGNSRLNILADRNATVFAFNPIFERDGRAYEFLDDRYWLASLKVEKDLDLLGGLRLTSVTAYQDRNSRQRDDSASWSGSFVETFADLPDYNETFDPNFAEYSTAVEQWTQELRLQTIGAGPLNVVVGGFYSHLRQRDDVIYSVEGADVGALALTGFESVVFNDSRDRFREEQLGLFADATWTVTPRFSLAAGVRYTRYDQRASHFRAAPAFGDFAGATSFQTAKDEPVTPRFSASYQASDDFLVYASAAKGFRTGGGNPAERLNPGRCPDRSQYPARPDQYGPDSVWNYELGARGRAGPLSFAGAVYQLEWTDIQTSVFFRCADRTVLNWTDNAASARTRGVEVEGRLRLATGLTLPFSAAYTDAEFSEDSPEARVIKGAALPYVPEITYAIGLDYAPRTTIAGVAPFARVDYRYVDERRDSNFGDPLEPGGPRRDLPSYGVLDASVGFRSGPWSVVLRGQNLTNEDAALQSINLDNALGLNPRGAPDFGVREVNILRARTVLLSIGRSF